MEENSNSYFPYLIAIIAFAFGIFLGGGKYEDMTAEEWFNEYDAVVGCVEDASTLFEAQNCL